MKEEMMNINKFLKSGEAATFLKTSLSTLARWRHLGIGPSYSKLETGSILYEIDNLAYFVESNKIVTNSESY